MPSGLAEEMHVRRLGWAGLEVTLGEESLVVDLLEDMTPLAPFVGEALTPLPGPSHAGAAGALLTHLHTDHTDAQAVARALAPEGVALRPPPAEGEGMETVATLQAEEALTQAGVATRVTEPWQSEQIGPFTVTAVPAADGFGDPQVSWVIEGGGRRIFHGGDTVLHGSWWLITMRHGPFDAAFLPANGALCDFPHRQPPSPLPCTMDPVQAAAAARLLGAGVAVPIHYDTIHRPPVYAQVDRPAEAFLAAAEAQGVTARVLDPGQALDW